MSNQRSTDQNEVVGTVRVGDILSGKYQIERVLGVGGMGVVVAARHLQLEELVAIKFLLPEGLQNKEAVARFEREARAAVKIKSEHVARMIDVGKLENGAPYIVMEYLEGANLGDTIRSRGTLTVEEAVEFMLHTCEAMAEAHSRGIVHRDLKPENLFVVRRGDGLLAIKVLDFGISKISPLGGSGRDMGMTKTSTVMGSPLYMSPEQMQSARDTDARTDIWAIGVILYEALTGNPPFLADSMPELVAKILTREPDSILRYRPDLPRGFEQVILRCLTKDRNARYANVAELAMALVEYGPKRGRASAERVSRTLQAAGLTTSALSLPPSRDVPSDPPATGTLASWGRTGERSRNERRTTSWKLPAAIVVVLVGAAALLIFRSKSPAVSESNVVQSTAVHAEATTPPPVEIGVAPVDPKAAATPEASTPAATSADRPHLAPRPDIARAPVRPSLPPPPNAKPNRPAQPPTSKPDELGGRF